MSEYKPTIVLNVRRWYNKQSGDVEYSMRIVTPFPLRDGIMRGFTVMRRNYSSHLDEPLFAIDEAKMLLAQHGYAVHGEYVFVYDLAHVERKRDLHAGFVRPVTFGDILPKEAAL